MDKTFTSCEDKCKTQAKTKTSDILEQVISYNKCYEQCIRDDRIYFNSYMNSNRRTNYPSS